MISGSTEQTISLYTSTETVEKVQDFRLLGTHLAENISWTAHTTATVKKAQQCWHFPRVLKRNRLQPELLVRACYHTASQCGMQAPHPQTKKKTTAHHKHSTHKKVTGCHLSSFRQIAVKHYISRGIKIVTGSSHPGHNLFQMLPSGKHFRSLKTRTSRLKSLFPQAITLNKNNYTKTVQVQ